MPRFHPDRPSSAAMLRPSPENPKPKGGARLLSVVLQAFVMAVVLALFFLFAGLAAIVLLHLFVLGRAVRSRRRTAFSAPDPAIRGGLSAAELTALPRSKFGGRSAVVCAVCLDEMKEGQGCRTLPDCGHVYHVQCVDRWLVRTPACPICRSRVGPATSEPASSVD